MTSKRDCFAMLGSPDLFELLAQPAHDDAWLEGMCDWLCRAARLSGGDLQLALLVLLLRRHGRAGHCVSASRLAVEAGLPRQTLRRKLETLRGLGIAAHEGSGWRLGR